MSPGLSKHIHALFAEIAQALNDEGVDIRTFLEDSNVDWTPLLVKEIIWRTAMQAVTQATSSKQLSDEKAEKLLIAITDRIKQKHHIDVWERINTNY